MIQKETLFSNLSTQMATIISSKNGQLLSEYHGNIPIVKTLVKNVSYWPLQHCQDMVSCMCQL